MDKTFYESMVDVDALIAEMFRYGFIEADEFKEAVFNLENMRKKYLDAVTHSERTVRYEV